MKLSNKNLIISIFGLPGSGKSTIAKTLLKEYALADEARLVGDYFLKEKNEATDLEEYMTKDFYDWQLIEKYLDIEINESEFLPEFDFTKFERIGLSDSKRFIKTKLSIVDSTFAYIKADIKVLVKLDDEIRKERIENRIRPDDTWKKYYLANWSKVNKKLKDNINFNADFVLDSVNSIDSNLEIFKSFYAK